MHRAFSKAQHRKHRGERFSDYIQVLRGRFSHALVVRVDKADEQYVTYDTQQLAEVAEVAV